MKRAILLFLFLLLLCGCRPGEFPPAAAAPETSMTETAPPEPQSLHSALYQPEVDVREVITYFNEVCLAAEIVNSGNPAVLQRWEIPVSYQILGDPTAEDLAALTGFAQWLNTVEGFPGIAQTQDATQANLRIHFCTQEEMLSIMGDSFTGMDGAVTFWYREDAIYDAIICIRTDLDQDLRNSVILEELYNGLGPIQDTTLRPDSIIYAEFSQPQMLTEMDELILRLLYHPRFRCGMTPKECEAAIRELYY